MNKAKALRKEINEILLKPMPWGPMIVPRIKTALIQSLEFIEVLDRVSKELDMKVKFYEGTRADAKISRNLSMLNLYEKGKTLESIASEYGLTKQRVHQIIKITRKHLENQYDPTRIEGISRESNSISERAIGSGKEEDYPANTDRRW